MKFLSKSSPIAEWYEVIPPLVEFLVQPLVNDPEQFSSDSVQRLRLKLTDNLWRKARKHKSILNTRDQTSKSSKPSRFMRTASEYAGIDLQAWIKSSFIGLFNHVNIVVSRV